MSFGWAILLKKRPSLSSSPLPHSHDDKTKRQHMHGFSSPHQSVVIWSAPILRLLWGGLLASSVVARSQCSSLWVGFPPRLAVMGLASSIDFMDNAYNVFSNTSDPLPFPLSPAQTCQLPCSNLPIPSVGSFSVSKSYLRVCSAFELNGRAVDYVVVHALAPQREGRLVCHCQASSSHESASI